MNVDQTLNQMREEALLVRRFKALAAVEKVRDRLETVLADLTAADAALDTATRALAQHRCDIPESMAERLHTRWTTE